MAYEIWVISLLLKYAKLNVNEPVRNCTRLTVCHDVAIVVQLHRKSIHKSAEITNIEEQKCP